MRRKSRPTLPAKPRDQQAPEVLGAYHKAEIEKWWPIKQASGHQCGPVIHFERLIAKLYATPPAVIEAVKKLVPNLL